MVPPSLSESPPCKKFRLQDSKPDVRIPLRIDTDRARSVRSIKFTQVKITSNGLCMRYSRARQISSLSFSVYDLCTI